MAITMNDKSTGKIYTFYTIVFEPNYRVWRDKRLDEEPVREMKIKLSATDIIDAQTKAWKVVNLDPEAYEIISIYTDGYFNKYHNNRYGDTDD